MSEVKVTSYQPPSLRPLIPNAGKWDKNTWIVTETGCIEIEYKGHEMRLEWHPGFVTDGGSVPRIAWRVTGHPMGDWLRDYLTHDAFYAAEWFTRVVNDWIFREMLKEHGCGLIVRNLIYRTVRLAGGITGYKRHTPESIAENRRLCPLWIDGIPITETFDLDVECNADR